MKITKNHKIALVGIGSVAAGYFLLTGVGAKEEYGGGSGGIFGIIPEEHEEALVSKKEDAVLSVPETPVFTGFIPPFEGEDTYIPSVKSYEQWIESIEKPPIPAKKEVVTSVTEKKTINPIIDVIMSVTDPSLPIAATAAKMTVEKYVPAKKESIAKAKEIPVKNITSVIQENKAEKKGFFGTLFSMLSGGDSALSQLGASKKTVSTEEAGKGTVGLTTVLGGDTFSQYKIPLNKAAATKKQKIGALESTAYTASFGPGAGIMSTIKNVLPQSSPRSKNFSAMAGRWGVGSEYTDYTAKKYAAGIGTTKKGGAVVTRGSGGWSGGSTAGRMAAAEKAGVYGLSYR